MNELRIDRNLARWLVLGIGAIGFIVMAVAWLADPRNSSDTVRWIGLAVGIVGVVGFILLDPQALAKAVTGRTGQYGITTVLMSLAFIIAVIAIFVIVRQVEKAGKISPWDLTKDQKYRISQQTIDLLSHMQDEVHVIGFYTSDPQGSDQQKEAEIWLQNYAKYSNGKLTYEFVDPDRNPGEATQLGMSRPNVMIFKRGNFTEESNSADESSMTGALVRVMSGEKRKLYMVTGHGERAGDNFDISGFSDAQNLLGGANFDVATLNLLEEGKVPEDASLVVVAGPTAQFAAPEVEALKAYLDAGGAALFLFDPATGGGQFGSGVLGVAFNSDGSRLATAGADGTVRIWDVNTKEELLTLRGHTSDVMDVIFSPDDKQIVTAGRDGTVRVWDASTGEQIKQLDGQTDGVRRLAYSPDGSLLASVGTNQALNVWNARTLEPESYSPVSALMPLYSVTFSPDGSLIAAGGGSANTSEGVVYLWKAESGEEVLHKTLHTDVVFNVVFSPDGAALHSVAMDGTEGTLDVATGNGSTETLYASLGITALVIKEDGTKIYAVGDGTIHIRRPDATSTEQDQVMSGHSSMIWAMRLSPDGKTLATGSRDGTARLWDIERRVNTASFTAHSGGDPLLNYLKDSWGIQVDDDVVIDMRTANVFDAVAPVTDIYSQTSPITKRMWDDQTRTVFLAARSIQAAKSPPPNVTLTPLIFTVGQLGDAWGETDPLSAQASYDPATDIPGPLTMGVSGENSVTKARVVVIGDADFASNQGLQQTTYGNGDLLLNSANWLAASENLIGLPTSNLDFRTMDKPLSSAGMIVAGVASICLIPLVGLVAGAVVWVVRRRRR